MNNYKCPGTDFAQPRHRCSGKFDGCCQNQLVRPASSPAAALDAPGQPRIATTLQQQQSMGVV